MKIDGNTTLGELAVIRAKYGIAGWTMNYVPGDPGGSVVVRAKLGSRTVMGRGETEPEALDDVLNRVMHLTGAEVSRCSRCGNTGTHGESGREWCATCGAERVPPVHASEHSVLP